jgi:hypothetical protein
MTKQQATPSGRSFMHVTVDEDKCIAAGQCAVANAGIGNGGETLAKTSGQDWNPRIRAR